MCPPLCWHQATRSLCAGAGSFSTGTAGCLEVTFQLVLRVQSTERASGTALWVCEEVLSRWPSRRPHVPTESARGAAHAGWGALLRLYIMRAAPGRRYLTIQREDVVWCGAGAGSLMAVPYWGVGARRGFRRVRSLLWEKHQALSDRDEGGSLDSPHQHALWHPTPVFPEFSTQALLVLC